MAMCDNKMKLIEKQISHDFVGARVIEVVSKKLFCKNYKQMRKDAKIVSGSSYHWRNSSISLRDIQDSELLKGNEGDLSKSDVRLEKYSSSHSPFNDSGLFEAPQEKAKRRRVEMAERKKMDNGNNTSGFAISHTLTLPPPSSEIETIANTDCPQISAKARFLTLCAGKYILVHGIESKSLRKNLGDYDNDQNKQALWIAKVLEVRTLMDPYSNRESKNEFDEYENECETVDKAVIDLKSSATSSANIRLKVRWTYSHEAHLPTHLPHGYRLGKNEIILSTSNNGIIDARTIAGRCELVPFREYNINSVTQKGLKRNQFWWRWQFDESTRNFYPSNKDDFMCVCRCRALLQPHEEPLIQCAFCFGLFHSCCLFPKEILNFQLYKNSRENMFNANAKDIVHAENKDRSRTLRALYTGDTEFISEGDSCSNIQTKNIGACVVYTSKIVCGQCSGFGFFSKNPSNNNTQRADGRSTSRKTSVRILDPIGQERQMRSLRFRNAQIRSPPDDQRHSLSFRTRGDGIIVNDSIPLCHIGPTYGARPPSDSLANPPRIQYSIVPPRFTTLDELLLSHDRHERSNDSSCAYQWEPNIVAPIQSSDLGFTYLNSRRLHGSWIEFNRRRLHFGDDLLNENTLNDILEKYEKPLTTDFKLHVFWTGSKRGWGLRTESFIRKDSLVIHYIGEVIPMKELMKREAIRLPTDALCLYQAIDTLGSDETDKNHGKSTNKYRSKECVRQIQNTLLKKLQISCKTESSLLRKANKRALKDMGQNRMHWASLSAIIGQDVSGTNGSKTSKKNTHDEGNTHNEGKDQGSDKVSFGVDPLHFGNVARIVNHSCDPCMKTYQVRNEKSLMTRFPPGFYIPPRLAYYASRDIQAGEELTVDYLPSCDIDVLTKLLPCECGAPNCRKWVF